MTLRARFTRFALAAAVMSCALAACATAPGAIEAQGARGAAPTETRRSALDPVARPAIARRPSSVVIGRDDSVYTISEQYQVALRALIEANDLSPPYDLRPGSRLALPAPNVHVVKKGDTLFAISRRYRVHLRSLAVMNGLREPYMIQPGQPIYLPSLATDWAERANPVAGRSSRASALRGAPRFDWPLDGRVLARFSPEAGPVRNDGVKIAAVEGEPVKAAADGTVVYAGAELRGYGNLILVQHRDEWVSAYAHNREILVAENQRVSRGDVLAFAGSTGAVDTPQLHFEIRRRGRPVDPLAALP